MASFQKRGARWRAIVRKQGHAPQSKSFSTKARAVAWARDIEHRIDSGAFAGEQLLRSVTVGELLDRHLVHLERTSSRGDRTASDHRGVKEGLGADLPLSALSYQTLATYCQTRIDVDGVLPSTTKGNVMFLSGAISTGLLELNLPTSLKAEMAKWCQGLQRAGLIGNPQSRDRRPTSEEIELLLTHVQHNKALRAVDYGAMIRFAVTSAMRLGEICSIRWEDYNREAGTIKIWGRKHPTNKAINHQVVPLLLGAQEVIDEQPQETERIFPFNAETVSNGFRRISRGLGIEALRFHDLRHEGISRLFEAGYQIQEVAMVSGHKDWKGLKRYVNLRPGELVDKDCLQRAINKDS